MTTTKAAPRKAALSLDAIAAKVASETPQPLELSSPDDKPSGVVLQVLSDQAPSVVAKVNALVNEKRRQDAERAAAAAEAASGLGRRRQPPPIVLVEDETRHFRRLVAARVAGWNLDDPCTEENVVRLFNMRPDWTGEVLAKADRLNRFTLTSARS